MTDFALTHLSPEDRLLIRHLFDLGERALREEAAVQADFLDPRQREVAGRELAILPGLRALFHGGYRRAERQRLTLAPDYLLLESIRPGLAFLEIKPARAADLTHGDYLGAILGLGLAREKTGDLIVLPAACQCVVAEESAPYIQANLRRVASVGAEVAAIEPEQLQVPPEREKEIRTTVASLRLDAVASDGFGVSRTRMAREIRAGCVRVNWQVVQDPDKTLSEGDVISIRGRGRVILTQVAGETKKGRRGLMLKRLI